MEIVKATLTHLDAVAGLFNEYRIFYNQKTDIDAATAFLKDRITKNQSVILLAIDENDEKVGFTQLYPTYSSVSLQPFYILNDLFVKPSIRSKGVGETLLKAAKELCVIENCKGLALETATDNPAQKLYERLNWKQDGNFLHYFWKNQPI